MALEAGSRLGPYEIEALLGSGGMGEVYRARDSRLEREVAIKVLPEDVADPKRLQRFEQEAKAAGALNHPNVVAVYDIGRHDGALYVVSELLEGQTLRLRLEGEALPVRKALDHALQIAHGLAAAHDKGIVHRDLKPENLFVTEDGRVKILDFGLAKLTRPGPLGEEGARRDAEATRSGVVLGTVGYMSPEQVRGEAVDHRSDIFSLGVVLYEMLTGRRAFRHPSAAETMNAILKEDPPELSGTDRAIPPGLARIVERTLEKRAGDRFHSAHDLALALEAASSGLSGSTPKESSDSDAALVVSLAKRHKAALLATLGAVALVAGGLYLGLIPSERGAAGQPGAPKITPFTADGGLKRSPQLSPDGERVAYAWAGPSDDDWDIYVKALGHGAKPLRVTEGEGYKDFPTWSPDGRQIAFLSITEEGPTLAAVPSLGGQQRKLVDVTGVVRMFNPNYVFPAPSWSPDGEWLLFAEKASDSEPSRIVRLSTSTLEKQPLTSPPEGSLGDFYPSLSPDGRTLAFVRSGSSAFGALDVWVRPTEAGEARRVTFGEHNVILPASWTSDGNEILFSAAGEMLRVSPAGGEPQPVPGIGRRANSPSVRRDRMVYVQMKDQNSDIWRVPGRQASVPGQSPERLILSSGYDGGPAYSPDGQKIAFTSSRSGGNNIWVCDDEGSDPIQLTTFEAHSATPRWSPDGKSIAFDSLEAENSDIYIVDADGGVPRRLTRKPSADNMGTWSRDGQWVYFGSDRSGRWEIWKIRSEGGEAVQVTRDGGFRALESWEGDSLFYSKSTSSGIWRRPVSGGEEVEVIPGPVDFANWDVSRSGLYFATRKKLLLGRTEEYSIRFLDFQSGETKELHRQEGPFLHAWLAASPDDAWVLYSAVPSPASELILVERFH